MQKNYTQKQNHKTKKSLGQNFLKSNLALKKIIEAGEISDTDIILEIGPGKGALTEKLLEKAGLVIAVEKDRDLFALLSEKFAEQIKNKKLILIEDDILKFNINMKQNIFERTLGRSDGDGQKKFSAENFRGESKNILRNYKIIANIPYNITGAILKKFLTEKYQPSLMVLMVQNEVAQRIVARNKKESILSISVKAYGEPKIIMKVPARYFSPAPKVDSAVLLITSISKNFFIKNKIKEKKFFEIIHAGFAHKRKKLSNNLKKILQKEKNMFADKRAEELSLEDWLKITKS